MTGWERGLAGKKDMPRKILASELGWHAFD